MDLVPKPAYQPFAVGATVDATPVFRALERAIKLSQQELRRLVLNTAFYTAYHAYKQTERIAQTWIDSSMEVDVISYTNATRKVISKAKRGTGFTKTPANPFLPAKAVPLAVLVVMARHRAGSRWNEMTDNRWNLVAAALPTGKGTAAARQAQITGEITRMIRSRHSSAGFLRKGWSDCLRQIKRLGAERGTSLKSLDVEPRKWEVDTGSAEASFAPNTCMAIISNDIGTVGTPNLSTRRQYYLFSVGGLALERAILLQAEDMKRHYMETRGLLEAEWNKL